MFTSFRIPRLLPCSHCYCEVCLGVQLQNHTSKSLKCPECRKCHPVSTRGVKTFPQNKYTLALLRASVSVNQESHSTMQKDTRTTTANNCCEECVEGSQPEVRPVVNSLPASSSSTRTICDVCHATLFDERNLYIHKILKHGECFFSFLIQNQNVVFICCRTSNEEFHGLSQKA